MTAAWPASADAMPGRGSAHRPSMNGTSIKPAPWAVAIRKDQRASLPGAMRAIILVAALVAVNAVGDVIDPDTGRVVAGVRDEEGRTLADARKLTRAGALSRPRSVENTTIGLVATNAALDKVSCPLVAQGAHDGLARSVSPAHARSDGDAFVAAAVGGITADADVVRSLAVHVVSRAVGTLAEGTTGP